MNALQRGEHWRLTKTQTPLGGFSNDSKVPADTVVTVVDPMVDHLDWFCCTVRLPNGDVRRMPWALDKYAEKV